MFQIKYNEGVISFIRQMLSRCIFEEVYIDIKHIHNFHPR